MPRKQQANSYIGFLFKQNENLFRSYSDVAFKLFNFKAKKFRAVSTLFLQPSFLYLKTATKQ